MKILYITNIPPEILFKRHIKYQWKFVATAGMNNEEEVISDLEYAPPPYIAISTKTMRSLIVKTKVLKFFNAGVFVAEEKRNLTHVFLRDTPKRCRGIIHPCPRKDISNFNKDLPMQSFSTVILGLDMIIHSN